MSIAILNQYRPTSGATKIYFQGSEIIHNNNIE